MVFIFIFVLEVRKIINLAIHVFLIGKYNCSDPIIKIFLRNFSRYCMLKISYTI